VIRLLGVNYALVLSVLKKKLKLNSMALVRKRTMSAKLEPTVADRGCRVVSATDPKRPLISVF
jgi:hypothetical protein